ncbi:hypothetical protein [Legionella tunisiensis]|uniref:hypothetical protein n=1 Tax=Legionella tunisiensis TaxID=1034944 RepID=UPI0002D9A14B|nr:hypothetical protein [Legionella tunisiensis]
MENKAKNSIKHRIGNCDELSDVAASLLFDVVSETPLFFEKFSFLEKAGYDHCFLVVNRSPNSDPRDITTWGQEALICDPWGNAVFDVSWMLSGLAYQNRMFDYINSGLQDPNEALEIEYRFESGIGHTLRWQEKHRGSLWEMDDYWLENKKTGLSFGSE